MMIARWHVDCRFSYKDEVLTSLRGWFDDVGREIGLDPSNVRFLTGSIGAAESKLEMEITVNDLADLNEIWNKMGNVKTHPGWARKIEPFLVSGSPYWTVYRVL